MTDAGLCRLVAAVRRYHVGSAAPLELDALGLAGLRRLAGVLSTIDVVSRGG